MARVSGNLPTAHKDPIKGERYPKVIQFTSSSSVVISVSAKYKGKSIIFFIIIILLKD